MKSGSRALLPQARIRVPRAWGIIYWGSGPPIEFSRGAEAQAAGPGSGVVPQQQTSPARHDATKHLPGRDEHLTDLLPGNDRLFVI